MFKTLLKIACIAFFLVTIGLSEEKTQVQNAMKNPFLKGQKQPVPVLVIAHRGARAYAPENTIAAFQKGIEMGAHMFELDVHLTKDGVPIVVHDDTLVRCSDVVAKFPGREPYCIDHFTLEEIQKLDAGSWYIEEIQKPAAKRQAFLRNLTDEDKKRFITEKDMQYYASGLVRHPTLEECLLLAKKHKTYVNIEIKQVPRFYPGITEKVVQLVEKLEMENDVILSCFDHYQIVLAKKLNPRIATAALCEDRVYEPGFYCAKYLDADAYNPGSVTCGIYSVTHERKHVIEDAGIQNALASKIGINVWTINDPAHMQSLLKAGVTGIFTDYPDRLIDLLQKAK